MKRHFLPATLVSLGLAACAVPSFSSLPVNATAAVAISGVSGAGSLTTYSYAEFTFNGYTLDASRASASASVGHSSSISGASYVEIHNDTSSEVMLSSSPTLTISASGQTGILSDGGPDSSTATSSIGLLGVTASGSCHGAGANSSYSDPKSGDPPKTATVSKTDYQPGDSYVSSGSFSCSVYGG